MRRGLVALVACTAWLHGCATPWPQGVVTTADPAFARAAPSLRVDVLPIDLALWVDEASRGAPEPLRGGAESAIVGRVASTLFERGYTVGGLIDWDGNYVGADGAPAPAIDPGALDATIDSLSTYGTAVERTHALPAPYLPAQLGVSTGSDATLYIGGWSFVGDDTSHGAKVAEYVLIAVVIVAVVAIIAVAASKGGGGGGGAAHVASGVGHAMVSVGRASAHGVAHVGGAGGAVVRGSYAGPRLLGAMLRTADVFGRVATSLQYDDERPDWYHDGPKSGHSAMYLEMTLVDNHTGLVLWHAHQRFPANASQRAQIDRAVASLLASLPPAR